MNNWFDLPKLKTFTTGDYAFPTVSSLTLSSMMIIDWMIDLIFLNSLNCLLEAIHSWMLKLSLWKVWQPSFDSFDLPQLKSFTADSYAFQKVSTLTLKSSIVNNWIIRSSSIEIIDYRTECIRAYNYCDNGKYDDWWLMIDLIFFNSLHSLQDHLHSMRQQFLLLIV